MNEPFDPLDALCLWEAVLEDERRVYVEQNLGDTTLRSLCEQEGGVYAARQLIIDITPYCTAAWRYAHETLGFDDSFDWEWCPRYLAVLAAHTEWREAAKSYADIAHKVTALYRQDHPDDNDWRSRTFGPLTA